MWEEEPGYEANLQQPSAVPYTRKESPNSQILQTKVTPTSFPGLHHLNHFQMRLLGDICIVLVEAVKNER